MFFIAHSRKQRDPLWTEPSPTWPRAATLAWRAPGVTSEVNRDEPLCDSHWWHRRQSDAASKLYNPACLSEQKQSRCFHIKTQRVHWSPPQASPMAYRLVIRSSEDLLAGSPQRRVRGRLPLCKRASVDMSYSRNWQLTGNVCISDLLFGSSIWQTFTR